MTKKTAIDATVQHQLSSLTIENEALKKRNSELDEENKALRKQNVQLCNVVDTDLKADKIVNIMAISDYKQSDLEDLDVEQLQQIQETLLRSKGADKTAVFKPIRTGAASETSRLTVGDLKGKSRAEILALGGDF